MLKLYELGLWPNGPIREHKPIRGWSTEVIMGMTWEEEIKVIYDSLKICPRRIYLGNVGPRSVKTVLSP